MGKNYQKKWWDDATAYIIYPEAFKDSNGDGVGDIQGIISKLGYLKELGISFILLNPIFDSYGVDAGFDILSYFEINPYLGSKEDLKELITSCHRLGLKIGLDIPINNTSTHHPWFKKALKDPTCEEASYYFLKKAREVDGIKLPPTNWKGYYYESAWGKIDEDNYYLSLFSKETADLNYGCEALRKEILQVFIFYAKLGIDAIKFSGASQIGKDFSFSNSMLKEEPSGMVFDEGKFTYTDFSINFFKEVRAKLKGIKQDLCLIAELPTYFSTDRAAELINKVNGPFDLVFTQDIFWNNELYKNLTKEDSDPKTNVISLKNNLYKWYERFGDNASLALNWGNIDVPRILTMYGDRGEYRDASAKAIFTTFLFMYGTPFLFQGEEIGMDNPRYENIDDYLDDVYSRNEIKDLIEEGYEMKSILNYIKCVSRINSRTPIQWSNSENAGFSSALTKRKVNEDYKNGINIEDQMHSTYSILNYYQYAIEKRKSAIISSIIEDGKLELLDVNHPDVFAYIHEGNERIVCIASFRPYQTYFSFYYRITDIILHNYEDVLFDGYSFTLRPFEVFLIKID